MGAVEQELPEERRRRLTLEESLADERFCPTIAEEPPLPIVRRKSSIVEMLEARNAGPQFSPAVGCMYTAIGVAIVRSGEDLDSPTVAQLLPEMQVKVVALGLGRRVQIHCEAQNIQGWVS